MRAGLLPLLSLAALDATGCDCAAAGASGSALRDARERMVQEQIVARGVSDPRVLDALRTVPRHEFVAAGDLDDAYEDHPLPIGEGQTISQPYIVALMTALARVAPGDTVLEIGTGSGYQAAVLDALGAQVFSIEIVPELARSARERLARLGYRNVTVREGDGYLGWPEEAPFTAIVVTAAPPRVPGNLLEQLAMGGRLVIPVGRMDQELRLYTRTDWGFAQLPIVPVRFVPMVSGGDAR